MEYQHYEELPIAPVENIKVNYEDYQEGLPIEPVKSIEVNYEDYHEAVYHQVVSYEYGHKEIEGVDSSSLLIPEVLAGTLEKLIYDILEIFSYLSPVNLVLIRRVCKKWNSIGRMDSLCKYVAFCRDGVIPKQLPASVTLCTW